MPDSLSSAVCFATTHPLVPRPHLRLIASDLGPAPPPKSRSVDPARVGCRSWNIYIYIYIYIYCKSGQPEFSKGQTEKSGALGADTPLHAAARRTPEHIEMVIFIIIHSFLLLHHHRHHRHHHHLHDHHHYLIRCRCSSPSWTFRLTPWERKVALPCCVR